MLKLLILNSLMKNISIEGKFYLKDFFIENLNKQSNLSMDTINLFLEGKNRPNQKLLFQLDLSSDQTKLKFINVLDFSEREKNFEYKKEFFDRKENLTKFIFLYNIISHYYQDDHSVYPNYRLSIDHPQYYYTFFEEINDQQKILYVFD